MTLVETILIAIILVSVALATSYFFAQTQITMKSSSQVMKCQTIVKQALENAVSLGTRLYGYKIKHDTANLKYDPLFITKNSKAYDVDDNIQDVGDGSQFNFPPQKYQGLYKNLVGMDISPPIKVSMQSNTGHPIISDKSTHPIEISTSTLIVNSVNALQYLYNSDAAYSTGDGKNISTGSGLMSSLLQKYKDQFNLGNIEFYVKIVPIKDGAIINTRPILTRPRFPANSNEIASDLKILGETGVGFEIKAKLEYEHNDQEFTCDSSRQFYHQMTGASGDPMALDVTLKGLKNGVGEDFLSDTNLVNTSCNTHGGGYEDITVTLDFNTITDSQQFGTVILCQMNSYCRSEGYDDGYTDSRLGDSCTPEKGRWRRCHDIQPNPDATSDQEWTFRSKLKSKQVLNLQFDDMKVNRRYDLNIAEFAIDGETLRTQKVVFYIDKRRPYNIVDIDIVDDDVGLPDDNVKKREYAGPLTNWKTPVDSVLNKWIQCNQNDVDFQATIEDQFTHNLDCEVTGSRKDGNGQTPITGDITHHAPDGNICKATLSSLQHGRQTLTIIPKDSCEKGSPSKNLVWDTDLPELFESKGFFDDKDDDPTDGEIWVKTQTNYPIRTKVPAKTTAGKLPKHYSLDCQDKYIGSKVRDDGDGKPLTCTLTNPNASDADGANPNDFDIKFYHVCGGNECKGSKWAVYPPVTGSCVNVKCEGGYICCDDSSDNDCGGVLHQQCQKDKWPHKCDDPPCGPNSPGWKGCPPYGLYDCNYGNWECLGATDVHRHSMYGTDCRCGRGKYDPCDGRQNMIFNSMNPQGIGTIFCKGTRKSPDIGTGYILVYKNRIEDLASQRIDNEELSGLQYKCSLSERGSCGDSDDPRPCPMWPKTHSCAGRPSCTKRATYRTCLYRDRKTNQCRSWEYPCIEWEDPYRLSCSISFIGGSCKEPKGSCTPKGRGGGDKTNEKATKRSVCSSHCNSLTHCCSGDLPSSNSNCP